MIGHLSGKIIHQDEQTLLIDVGGVGYEVFVGNTSESKIGEVGKVVSVWVYTYVREDQLTLFGFKEQVQKKIFLVLTAIDAS